MARRQRSQEDGSDKNEPLTVEERVERIKADLDDVSLTVDVQTRDLTSLRGRLDKLKDEMEEIAEGASAEDLARVEDALASLEGRLKETEDSLISRTADIEAVREELAGESGRLSEQLEELKGELSEQFEAVKDELSGQLEEVQGELDSSQKKHEEFQIALDEKFNALKDDLGNSADLIHSEEFVDFKGDMESKLSELSTEITGGMEGLRGELDSVKDDLAEAAQSVEDLRTEFDEKVSATGDDLEALRDDLAGVKESLDGADQLAAKAKSALKTLEDLQARLERTNKDIAATASKVEATSAQVEESRKGAEEAGQAVSAARERIDANIDAVKMALRLVEELDDKVKKLNAQPMDAASAPSPASRPSGPIIEPIAEDDDISAVDLDYNLADVLGVLVKHGASDLHLKAGTPPTVRLNGELVSVGGQVLTPQHSKALVYSAMSKAQRAQLATGDEVDFAYVCDGVRYRVNAFLERGNVSAAFRMLRTDIPTIDSLNLPPVLKALASNNNGIILVTGPAGSGKSTTLAAMVDYINSNRKCHVVTIEDPIEFFHKDKESIITQREVGSDTETFAKALKMVLRQDPNVIMVGEMRDPETIMTAVTAAETGHLVLSTLHTPNTIQSVNRIIDTFSGDLQRQFRLVLANSLRGVISQKLLSRADEKGRVAAIEVMVVTPTISSLILEGKTNEIYPYIREGANDGMQTFTQAMLNLCNQGLITREEGMFHSDQPTEFRLGLEASGSAAQTDLADDTLMNWL